MYSHHDEDVSPCNVCKAVVGADLVHVVGEDRHDEPTGVVARPCPGFIVTGMVHIHHQLKGDLGLEESECGRGRVTSAE